MPLPLLIGPFVLCPILYWLLIQWGRSPTPEGAESKLEKAPPAKAEALAMLAEKRPALRPIDKEEEAALQNCFSWAVYYLQKIEYRPQALICRGQLRTSPEVAYKTIRENVESHFGDRFLVVFQEGLNGKPFFALVPNPQAQPPNQSPQQALSQAQAESKEAKAVWRPGLALGLLVATLFTTTLAGVVLMRSAEEDLVLDGSMLVTGLPYALTLMAILGTHEMAHYLAARRYKIRATLPYFIPIPPAGFFPFGTFGAFIQMRSPIPNRKALFDVGIAGPMAGFLMTLPLLFWGLANSSLTPLTEESSLLNFDSFRPSASLLLFILSRLAIGSDLTTTSAIQLHPVAIAGCLGLVITALNLMPVGQLDGGHIVHAMFGQRVGAMIGQIARLLVLALSFVQREFLLWAILLFFIPVVDEPALNDVSELDNQRDFWGLVALGLLVIIVLPAPPVLTQVLL